MKISNTVFSFYPRRLVCLITLPQNLSIHAFLQFAYHQDSAKTGLVEPAIFQTEKLSVPGPIIGCKTVRENDEAVEGLTWGFRASIPPDILRFSKFRIWTHGFSALPHGRKRKRERTGNWTLLRVWYFGNFYHSTTSSQREKITHLVQDRTCFSHFAFERLHWGTWDIIVWSCGKFP